MAFSQTLRSLILALLSALTYPIGSAIGILLPINDRFLSKGMAFGSGTLLCAVSLEMYGILPAEEMRGKLKFGKACTMIVSGILGAFAYTMITKWLEASVEKEQQDAEHALESAPEPKDYGTVKTRMQLQISQEEAEMRQVKTVAYSVLIGVFIEGVPEGVFMGLLGAEGHGHLSWTLVIAILVSNFPEAFAVSSLLSRAGMHWGKILCLWTFLWLLTGVLACFTCALVLHAEPDYADLKPGDRSPFVCTLTSVVEGFSGGVLLACVCSAMLPDADHRGKQLLTSTGFMASLGFFLALSLKLIDGADENPKVIGTYPDQWVQVTPELAFLSIGNKMLGFISGAK